MKKQSLWSKISDFRFLLLGLFLVIALWEIISFSTKALFLPEFFKTLGSTILLFGSEHAMSSLLFSLLRLLLSFLISAVLGVTLGVLAGYYENLEKILSPLITILRAIPTIAVIFLLEVYVPHFSLYVVMLVLFPVLYQAALEGSKEVRSKYEYEFLLRGRKKISNITKVVLPLSLDYILLGFLQALGLGMKVEIMSETFSYKADFRGIGKDIFLSFQEVDYETMMSYVLLSLLLSFLLDGLLLLLRNQIEKKFSISKARKNRWSL